MLAEMTETFKDIPFLSECGKNYGEETAPYFVPRMAANTIELEDHYRQTEQMQFKGDGMDSFPLETYNELLDHFLKKGQIRDAMFLICMSNWGMRFSDVCRVRFSYIFQSDGSFKTVFTLPDGERKTGKKNIYYNNAATMEVVSLYLSRNLEKTPYDFMFTSESKNKQTDTLWNIEAGEIYDHKIREIQKKLSQNEEKSAHLSYLESIGQIIGEELHYKRSVLKSETETLQIKLEHLLWEKENYKGNCPNRLIQVPVSRRAIEDVLKKGLSEIHVYPKNGKGDRVNLGLKLNTHSLRKTYGDHFYDTGIKLRENGLLKVDLEMLKLLQDKFMHTNMNTTRHYNHQEENCFKTICTHMNIGLEIVRLYTEKNLLYFPQN